MVLLHTLQRTTVTHDNKFEVECCDKHGTFLMDEQMKHKLDAFFALGDSFVETGDITLMTGMMLLSSNIIELDGWVEVAQRYIHLGYGQQVAIIEFLGIGSKSFQRELYEKRKRYQKEIEVINESKTQRTN